MDRQPGAAHAFDELQPRVAHSGTSRAGRFPAVRSARSFGAGKTRQHISAAPCNIQALGSRRLGVNEARNIVEAAQAQVAIGAVEEGETNRRAEGRAEL